MSAIWLIPALIYLCNAQDHTGSPCITPDGNPGNCITIETCGPLYKLVRNGGSLQEKTLNLLRDSHCGFEEVTRKPKVCCPCITLANKTETGQCVDVLHCDHIKTELAKPDVTKQYIDYVYSLRCEGKTFSVCCGPPPSFESVPTPIPTRAPLLTVPRNGAPITPVTSAPPESRINGPIMPTTEPGNGPPLGPERRAPPVTSLDMESPSEHGNTASCTMSALPPDPATGCCGSSSESPKIFGGTNAAINQYPWLALIEYEREHRIKLLCGGALISGRYVLTAGHCVVGPAFSVNIPKNVRLGEYDTAIEVDCVEPEGGGEGEKECSFDPVIIPIERITAHPDYRTYPRNGHNDIALLRLASIPEYTDFVQPICLPTIDNTGNFQGSESLYAAGWGAVSDKISKSNIKQHVDLPFKTLEVCQQAYNVPMRRARLWDHQMCAGGEAGKDTCKGDSGGPLMHYRRTNQTKSYFEVIGVVSFGVLPCGMENVPGVYTKVFKYLPWIYSNIEP